MSVNEKYTTVGLVLLCSIVVLGYVATFMYVLHVKIDRMISNVMSILLAGLTLAYYYPPLTKSVLKQAKDNFLMFVIALLGPLFIAVNSLAFLAYLHCPLSTSLGSRA